MYQYINLIRTMLCIQGLRLRRQEYPRIHGFYKMAEKLILMKKKKTKEFLTFEFESTFNVEKCSITQI